MLTKITLRDQVKKYLQEQMMRGALGFGQRISLPAVAKTLDVSVTPIREALTQLEQIGIVEAIPNRGFFSAKIDIQLASELYPIIANLEYLGICTSRYSKADIMDLKLIQAKEVSFKNAVERIQSDIKFHELLLKNCNNTTLREMLHDLKLRVFLYEYYYMEDSQLANKSRSFHEDIIVSIEAGNSKKAAEYVKESWLTSIPFIKEKFNQN